MNNTHTYELKLSELALDFRLFERMLGVDDPDFLSHIQSDIDHIYQKLSDKLTVKGGYSVFSNVQFIDGHHIKISDETFFTGKIVCNMLKKAEKIAVFACTAGPLIESESKDHRNSGDVMGEYIVNTMGSLIVETGMDYIHEKLRANAESNKLKITNRYSPGYCDWHVSEQQKLFRLLPDNFCGITLTESSLMQPIKSVSGFIGLGADVNFNNYTCNICTANECIYRNIREMGKIS